MLTSSLNESHLMIKIDEKYENSINSVKSVSEKAKSYPFTLRIGPTGPMTPKSDQKISA